MWLASLMHLLKAKLTCMTCLLMVRFAIMDIYYPLTETVQSQVGLLREDQLC